MYLVFFNREDLTFGCFEFVLAMLQTALTMLWQVIGFKRVRWQKDKRMQADMVDLEVGWTPTASLSW